MASNNDPKSIHATLTTTTVDTALLTQFHDAVEITNRDTSNPLYVRFDGTDPVADAEGTFIVPVSSSKVFDKSANQAGTPGSTTTATACHHIKVLGNGGAYDIEGM